MTAGNVPLETIAECFRTPADPPDHFLRSIQKWNRLHPAQPQITRRCYTPSPEYVEWAKQMDK